MASQSEVTFGARLSNAESILTHLQSFTGYTPPSRDYAPANLQSLITSIKTQNNSAAGSMQAYSAAVDKRQQLFEKNNDSLAKIMSPIGAAVRAAFGRSSKEIADMNGLIIKIRGKKIKKGAAVPGADFISQSERSFGSLTQAFADMIAVLSNYGTGYQPANESIKVPALTIKLQELTQSNTAVTAAYGTLKQNRDDRGEQYKTLTTTVNGIKDAVKSQYGLRSTEYVLIKNLKV
jgi:hypothetical protein